MRPPARVVAAGGLVAADAGWSSSDQTGLRRSFSLGSVVELGSVVWLPRVLLSAGADDPGRPGHFDFTLVLLAQRHLQGSLKDPALTAVEFRKPEELTLESLPRGPATVLRVVARDGHGGKAA